MQLGDSFGDIGSSDRDVTAGICARMVVIVLFEFVVDSLFYSVVTAACVQLSSVCSATKAPLERGSDGGKSSQFVLLGLRKN